MPPTLTRAAVRALVHRALKHGVPREEAEDIVARSWERAAPRHDPSRGSLEALLEFHGPAVEVLVATASTAERMGEVPDFARSALGDLIEFRRIGDERVIHGDG